MNIGAISKRYAKALLAYASENGKEDLVYRQVKSFVGQYRKIEDLRKALESPALAKETKLRLLNEAAANMQTCPELMRFFELVLNEKREKLFIFICFSYIDPYHELKHIKRGKLITAVPVSSDTENRLRKLIEQSSDGKVEFQTKVDPSLIGGFVLQIASTRIDASVAGQLERVKKQFIEKNKRIV